ncbi:MAG: hypothetical protein COA86_15100 [Kangiella sp.]|nr:MAG: hypothetical protein COA86_15100 [Kangiella sp.]
MNTKIIVGVLLMLIFSLAILSSIPSELNSLDENGLGYFIGRILGGNLFSIFGVIAGVLLYKTGRSDLSLSKDTSGESFNDITKKNSTKLVSFF